MKKSHSLAVACCFLQVPSGRTVFSLKNVFRMPVKVVIFTPEKKYEMEKELKFAETVLLIDAAYLNRVAHDLSEHFGKVLGRELPKADLPVLLECLSLDAGVIPGSRAIQVIFIYDGASKRMDAFRPGDLEKELDNMAFQSRLGEFAIYAFEPSGMAGREELFLEALRLVAGAKEVKRLAVIPSEEEYGGKVPALLDKAEGKDERVVFGMNPPVGETACRWEMAGFAILQALGIKADEL